jgi:AcrR family transcriptional regulator
MGIAERKEREKQQRKQEIIQAAEKVFYSMGVDQATMDDIAAKAELSKGTLYLYFRSKEDLFFEVARKAIGMLNTHTSKAVESSANAIEKLGAMGKATIEFMQSHPKHMQAIISIMGSHTGELELTSGDVQGYRLWGIISGIAHEGRGARNPRQLDQKGYPSRPHCPYPMDADDECHSICKHGGTPDRNAGPYYGGSL